MANANTPVGFRPHSSNPRRRTYTVGGTAVAAGDLVGLNSSGLVELFVVATHLVPHGVVRRGAAAGAEVEVYDDLSATLFVAQFDGTFAAASCGKFYDFKGTTGIQEVDGSNSLYGHVEVLAHHIQPGSEETGADAKVVCRIRKFAVSERPILEPDHAVYSGTLAGHISLSTAADTDVLKAVRFMKLDPGGAGRNVTLLATLHAKGRHIRIANAADAAESLTVKNSAGTTVAVLNQNEQADFIYSGSAWVFIGSSTVVDMSS
ncbi:MAG: hypothetical protein IV100_17810 [Myxococcales bacterium]|nr:hypothetical protein [Myxococcales bacterium]